MSKHLVLVRHAKSSWSRPNTADIDRALKKRGRNDAALIGQWLNTFCFDRDIRELSALVSPASRACATFEHINIKLHDVETDLAMVKSMYLAEDRQLLKLIQKQDDALNAIMLVGHNPGMHTLVERLSNRRLEKYPTCATACLEFDITHWADIDADSCRTAEFCKPAELRPKD